MLEAMVRLPPSAVATDELRSALDSRYDTLAKLVWCLDSGETPEWVNGIGPGTLVVIDEAGMAGAVELARAVSHVLLAATRESELPRRG